MNKSSTHYYLSKVLGLKYLFLDKKKLLNNLDQIDLKLIQGFDLISDSIDYLFILDKELIGNQKETLKNIEKAVGFPIHVCLKNSINSISQIEKYKFIVEFSYPYVTKDRNSKNIFQSESFSYYCDDNEKARQFSLKSQLWTFLKGTKNEG